MKYLGQITDDNDLVNKKYVDDIADSKQSALSAGHNISLDDSQVSQTNSYVYIGSTPPSNSVDGDLWYDPEDGTIVNEFQSPINLVTSSTAPTNQSIGDLWLDTGTDGVISEKKWSKIATFDLSTATQFSITLDEPAIELAFVCDAVIGQTTTATAGALNINSSVDIAQLIQVAPSNTQYYSKAYIKIIGGYVFAIRGPATINKTIAGYGNVQMNYANLSISEKIECFKIFQNPSYPWASGTIEIYAR